MPTATETGYERKTGLFATAKRTFKEFSEDNGTDWAAALTYYAVLSMFPALIALLSIVGLVFDPREVTRVITDLVSQISPGASGETISQPIEQIAGSNSAAGIMLVVGLVGALWTASGYVGAFTRAANIALEVDEGRPFWKLRPLQMLITLVMILLLAVTAIAVVVSGPLAEAVGDTIGVGSTAVTVFGIVKWPVLVLIVSLMLAFLYYAAPNAKLRGFRFITPGSVLAIVIWIVASALFALYVSMFGSYNETYGSLGGVVLFLVWLWITNIAVLLGMQINAERERDIELEDGRPGAERELRLSEREKADRDERPATA